MCQLLLDLQEIWKRLPVGGGEKGGGNGGVDGHVGRVEGLERVLGLLGRDNVGRVCGLLPRGEGAVELVQMLGMVRRGGKMKMRGMHGLIVGEVRLRGVWGRRRRPEVGREVLRRVVVVHCLGRRRVDKHVRRGGRGGGVRNHGLVVAKGIADGLVVGDVSVGANERDMR